MKQRQCTNLGKQAHKKGGGLRRGKLGWCSVAPGFTFTPKGYAGADISFIGFL